jgi:hypothetical protein
MLLLAAETLKTQNIIMKKSNEGKPSSPVMTDCLGHQTLYLEDSIPHHGC